MAALFAPGAQAEDVAARALEEAGPEGIYDFAEAYGAGADVKGLAEGALKGALPGIGELLAWLRARAAEPIAQVLSLGKGLMAPVLLMALARCASPREQSGGARFLMRMALILGFSRLSIVALDAAQDCLSAVGAFSDVAAPALAALLTAMGMGGSAALVSPAAALAGDMAERLFRDWGLPLCRLALCTAIAGNLSPSLDLSRATKLFRRAANWGTGLAVTLFTALLSLQGTVGGAADGVALRTAKYAVDSAAPVIGSGVSDAWESYVAGMALAKNALGVSGIAALLAAGLRPVLICGASMLALQLIAAILDALGEASAARAAEQMGGICQMGLALSTGALAVGTVLMGAAMAMGGRIAG